MNKRYYEHTLSTTREFIEYLLCAWVSLYYSFIFQNIVLFSSFYCNKLKISICMGFLKLVLGLNTA